MDDKLEKTEPTEDPKAKEVKQPHHRGSKNWSEHPSRANREIPIDAYITVNEVSYTFAEVVNIVQFYQAYENVQRAIGNCPTK